MADLREFVDVSAPDSPVRGFLHLPDAASGDGLVLTHGAGVDCRSPLLAALAQAFCDSGLSVLRIDLPFRQQRPHGPPPHGSAERDQRGLERAVALLRQHAPGRAFLGGHSYGGRQASMLAASHPGLVDGLLLLSYPLHPPKRPGELRTSHFLDLRAPALFVHGTHDGFGTSEELSAALKLIPARTEVVEIEAAGHELLTKRNRDSLSAVVIDAFRRFWKD